MDTSTAPSTRLRRIVVSLIIMAMATASALQLTPQADAQSVDEPAPSTQIDQRHKRQRSNPPAANSDELAALRAGLHQLRGHLDSDALRWLALFDSDLTPLADAVEELEDDLDSLLLTISSPMTPAHYQHALVQLNAGIESWHVVANELSPYWEHTVSEWDAAWQEVTNEWEQAWTDAAIEWETQWDQAAQEIETEWATATSEWEQAWTDAATEWEQAWTDAAQEAEGEWETATNEWEQAWTDAATEWEQAWTDALSGN